MRLLRILAMIVCVPIIIVIDLLGAVIGLSVKAFKEGYQYGLLKKQKSVTITEPELREVMDSFLGFDEHGYIENYIAGKLFKDKK